jgi:hypothetical protein
MFQSRRSDLLQDSFAPENRFCSTECLPGRDSSLVAAKARLSEEVEKKLEQPAFEDRHQPKSGTIAIRSRLRIRKDHWFVCASHSARACAEMNRFVLLGNELRYYRKKDDPVPKGCLLLLNTKVAVGEEDVHTPMSITCKDGALNCVFATRRDALDWRNALLSSNTSSIFFELDGIEPESSVIDITLFRQNGPTIFAQAEQHVPEALFEYGTRLYVGDRENLNEQLGIKYLLSAAKLRHPIGLAYCNLIY